MENLSENQELLLLIKFHKRRAQLEAIYTEGTLILQGKPPQRDNVDSLSSPISINAQDCFNVYYRLDSIITGTARKMSCEKKDPEILEVYAQFYNENLEIIGKFFKKLRVFWKICILALEIHFVENMETKLLGQKLQLRNEEFLNSLDKEKKENERLLDDLKGDVQNFFELLEKLEEVLDGSAKNQGISEKNV